MEVNHYNKKKIILNFLIIIPLITSIIYIYISNNSINSNTRRKIIEINNDITTLYNYTETMSDFIVDNYKNPEYIIQLDFEKLKEDNRRIKHNFEEFKKLSLKTYMELKEDNHRIKHNFEEFKNLSVKTYMELKEDNKINKNMIIHILRNKALDYLRNIGIHKDNYESYIHIIYNYEKIIENIKNNHEKYFEQLLNIDYDNFIVSFAYLSENHEINYNNTVYKSIINETLYYDNSKLHQHYSGKYILNVYNYKYIEIFSLTPQKFM